MIYFNEYSFSDKYELGKELLDFSLPYREELLFPLDVTFGFEIEFFNGKFSQLRDEFYERGLFDWKVCYEPTVSYYDSFNNIIGGEVVSPILTLEDNNFYRLKEVCELIKFCFGEVNDFTAGHIHIGSQVFNDKYALNKFLIIWSVFEDVIKRFFAGEFLNIEENSKYATLCSSLFLDMDCDIDNILNYKKDLGKKFKSQAVSFYYFDSFIRKEKNTIEFRDIKGSLEVEVLQNNINFLIHLIEWCKKLDDKDIYDIKNRFCFNNFSNSYDEINFEKALFLSDNVFCSSFDKMCFLKQYFKDFYLYDGEIKKVGLVRKK